MAKAKQAVPEGLHTVTPQLVCDDANGAIAWYIKALGARERARALGPDGTIIHAELTIGNSVVFLNDAMMGSKGARAMGGSPISFWVFVEDCDAVYHRAIAAGAKPAGGPMGQLTDQFWGDRSGTIHDPEGYTWTIATHKEDLTPDEMRERQDAFFKQFAGPESRAGEAAPA